MPTKHETMTSEAGRYAREEMGREVEVVDSIVRASESLTLCEARDAGDSFALHLVFVPLPQGGEGWVVIDETDVADFERNR